MTLDLKKVRHFVAVYEEGSISKAAERENIAQPALTVHVRQLEAEFGAKLFERSARGVHPTPAGTHFYGLCRDILQRFKAMQQEMQDIGGAVAGSLRIGLMPSICRGPLALVLTRYAAAFPAVELAITEAYSGTLCQWVQAGVLDFAVCNRPASAAGLESRLLLSDRLMLVSGPEKAMQPLLPCRLADVPDLKLVLPSRLHNLRRLVDHSLRATNLPVVKTLEIDGLSATMSFIRRSDWSTMTPLTAVINDIGESRFVINPILDPRITSDIYAIHPVAHPLPLAAQKFVEYLRQDLAVIGATKL